MMKQTVLLVEPHEGLRENIKELLELEGYSVKTLHTDSLEGDFTKTEITAVLLISGLFLREAEMQLTFPTHDIPIIVFSADSDDLSLVPVGKWVPLPFQTEELLGAVQEAFSSTSHAQRNNDSQFIDYNHTRP
ncbi:MAG: hypothetical protein ABJE80_01730 [Reichenbachiella sp.]|uniref:hypothetical protein n=1 Tax=Reichenbachiella sp. TaxID=2184521 RepID=UPI003263A074